MTGSQEGKNTLAKRALAETGCECITPVLSGPVILGFSQEDPGAVARVFRNFIKENKTENLSCILIDEAQFLTKEQVRQLGQVADKLNYPVMCYGIRTDFRGELFEGSSELLALADNLIELKTICSLCSRKATMVVRKDNNGNVLTEGSKIVVGGNDIYMPVCRKHFRKLTKLI